MICLLVVSCCRCRPALAERCLWSEAPVFFLAVPRCSFINATNEVRRNLLCLAMWWHAIVVACDSCGMLIEYQWLRSIIKSHRVSMATIYHQVSC